MTLRPMQRTCCVGRYAPSPTGELHLGNLRTALMAWMSCRRQHGIFILRIEDLDGPRTIPGAEERMIDDLRWLGIDWDEGPDVGGPCGPYRQSERAAFYAAALTSLKSKNRIYPCACSRKDLREASAPHGLDPIYQGQCRPDPNILLTSYPDNTALRFCVKNLPPVNFEDLILGPQNFDLEKTIGDFIVRRRDGLWAYQLACAVDDGLMGVNEVLRGEDLVTSTPRQIALLQMFEWDIPRYGHLPLVKDEYGQRMCKRDGSCSIQNLRKQGMSPGQVRELIMNAPI